MWKIVSIVMLLTLNSCRGIPPEMVKKISIWNGAPERGAICRIVGPNMTKEIQCIDAYDEAFKGYACMTWNDVGVMAEYVETLKNRCARWKK